MRDDLRLPILFDNQIVWREIADISSFVICNRGYDVDERNIHLEL